VKPHNERALQCAIYTRKSFEEGLEQDFNSLHAQREACEAYIRSQQGEGWRLRKTPYNDGGLSGATMERPALKQLLADIEESLVDVVVVYKVDRLTRSLSDFARMVEIFDGHQVSFVAVTQQFNTTTSMGRLTLNVLLSFAQLEREVTGERIRDKIAASKRKGMWMGDWFRSATRCATGSWQWSNPKRPRSDIFSSDTVSWAACACSRKTLTETVSAQSYA
jgi:site-specific DNA recombinase